MDKNDINIHPLTVSQTSMWLGYKLNPDVPSYNVPYAFYISGDLNTDIFKEAFQELINSTDVLRTLFVDIDGIPYQKVLESYNHSVEAVNFNTDLIDISLDDWLQDRGERLFDMSKPLFDSVLLHTAEQEHIWFFNVHHLITDASSSILFFNKLSKLYAQIKNGTKSISNSNFAYSDYVQYEIDHRNRNKNDSAYWEKKIKAFNEAPMLYGENQKHQTTSKSNRVVLNLSLEQSEKLNALADQSDIKVWTKDLTLFNIFSSLLFTYLYRVSGQKKLAIGAPIHNRSTKKLKRTPGLFIEIFPLTVELTEDDTFYSLLQQIKRETNDYLKHAITGTSSAKVSRSFNTIFNYINSSFSDFDGLATKTEWIHPNHSDPAHKLRCHVYDFNATGHMKVVFDINDSILDKSEAHILTGHFSNILDAFLSNINTPIEAPSLLTEQESSLFLQPKLELDNPYVSILEHFETIGANMPNAIALQCDNETLTYNGLNKKANQLANYLIKNGMTPNQKVAIYNYRSTAYMVGVLAVMKAGGTFIPIASDQPKARVEFIVSNSGCSLILTEGNLKNNVANTNIKVIDLSEYKALITNESFGNLSIVSNANALAYVLYTSGSTGNPKGVQISHSALSNYLFWAKDYYAIDSKSIFPLFTSIGFDLTITSTFLPLLSGGRLIVYKENAFGPDTSLLQLLGDNLVNTIKLTPSHLTFLKDRSLANSNIHTMIVGGEDFKVNLGKSIKSSFKNHLKIFNEYGPTEATVGCIASEFDLDKHVNSSIPIGYPIKNMHAYILDAHKNMVPKGVVGALYLCGHSLANGYLKLDDLTSTKFIDNPFVDGFKMYHTGDLARINKRGEFEYLGRIDEQVKLRGYRIELSEIESNLLDFEGVADCAVVLVENNKDVIPEEDDINCTECGLPSNYPNTDFDEHGVCHLCNAFKGYKEKAEKYFKTEEELKIILTENKGENTTYDCLSLLSGGKDSTYILAQLVGMGLNVLAFTLDNGYISEQAKDNVNRIVKKLGVDHVYGQSEHMNAIFIDSLNRHQNVCNGCFKTIYTLSTKIAMEKKIPFIVTGLSRGQFFETRLTEELFWDENLDVTKIDNTILEVRKLYHREDDAVKKLLDVSIFEEDEVFEKVQFVDFYRYSDVSLEHMINYLENKVGWVRPTDTGRSTNCLINQVGIYVHKKEKGYSNYSFPYSWDVRLGHKTRDESLEEINEYIDEVEVKRIMDEIGYEESETFENDQKLVAYFTGDVSISAKELKKHLSSKLPSYMMPSNFKFLGEMPLTKNGKIDKKILKNLNAKQLELETSYVAPRNEIDELLEAIWKNVLRLSKIGIHDNFIALGGHSLAAIRVTSRVNEALEMDIPLNKVFNFPTIEEYSDYLEKTMIELLNE